MTAVIPRGRVSAPVAAGLIRPRLLTALSDSREARVALVTAPPGAGKTTLLTHFARAELAAGRALAWCRLEGSDAVTQALTTTLGAAVTFALEGAGRAVGSADDLLTLLDEPGPPLSVVVDDVQLLAGTAAEDELARIVALLPERVRFLLAARAEPAFLAAGPRLAGMVADISADDLRFRTWEVEALFRDHYRAAVAPEDAAALTRHTEGWAAGLQLFHLATKGRPQAERHRAVADLWGRSHLLRRYLTSNVLGALPADVADFLVRSAALGILEGTLCDRLLERRDSHGVLRDLADANLFTVRCDDSDWYYRYHAVMQSQLEAMLTERLGVDGARSWYRRAAELLEDAGHWPEAYRAHARAEDWGAGARLLHRHGVQAADTETVAASIVPALLDDDPWLALAEARRHRAAGRLSAAVSAFERAEQRFDDPRMRQRCRAEGRTLQAWLSDSAPAGSTCWDRLRAAVRADPGGVGRRAQRQAGPEWQLVAGLAALLDGRPDAALPVLAAVAAGPESFASLAARVAGAVVVALQGGLPDTEALVMDAEFAEYPWLARIASAAGDPARRRDLCDACDGDDDDWGALVVTLLADAGAELALRAARLDAAQVERCAGFGPAAPRVVVRCLGRFSLQIGGREVSWHELRPRAQAALRLLCLHAGTPVHEEVMLEGLWPSLGPVAGKRNLQVAVSSIRALLEPGRARGAPTMLQRRGESYLLALPEGSDVDVLAFGAAVARWRRGGPATSEVAAALETALTAYTGDLLPEDGPAEWVVGHRERLRADATDAAVARAVQALAGGDARGAVTACHFALRVDGYRDSAWQLLIEASGRAGDTAAAHQARLGYARALVQLGVAPEVTSR